MARQSIVGEKLGIEEMTYGPVEENGVILLFGLLHEKVGFQYIEEIRKGFPDCTARKQAAPGRYEQVKIEFEYRSSDFVRYDHLKRIEAGEKCDYIVCWIDDWEDCPPQLKVIALRDYCNIKGEEGIPAKIKHLVSKDIDTIVCPARKKGFEAAFVKGSWWGEIRILKSKINTIKYLAIYQEAPLSAITHIAKVKKIYPYKNTGKYRVKLYEKKKIKPIKVKQKPRKLGGLRGPVYTNLNKLRRAKNLDEVIF